MLIVPQGQDAGHEGEAPPPEQISTVPVKGKGAKLGPTDYALGLLVIVAASAMLLVGAGVGVTPALQAMEAGGQSELDGVITLGVAAMGGGCIVFGIGILMRIEMLRRMFLPAGILFALFSGFVATMTNLSPIWGALTVFFVGVTLLMWTAAGETYTGGGWPTWAISGPVAAVAAILAIVVGLNQKKAHETNREAREEQRKFDQQLANVRQEAIGCASDVAFAGDAILDIGPTPLDRGSGSGSATEQEKLIVEARKRATELVRKLDALETEFLRLRPMARDGWEAGRGLTLRIVRAVLARCMSIDNSSVGPYRAPLRQALDRAKSVHGATDAAKSTAEELRYLTDAIAWAEKVFSKTQ